MDSWTNHGLKILLETAEKDALYQQLLSNYRAIEPAYSALTARLTYEDSEIIETYLAAGEAVFYRFAQLAYHCGKTAPFL